MPDDDRAAEITNLLARLGELLAEAHRQHAPAQPARPLPPRVLLTPEEAAEALGVGRTTVYALIKCGDLESVQIGRLRRIPTDALAPCIARLGGNNDKNATSKKGQLRAS